MHSRRSLKYFQIITIVIYLFSINLTTGVVQENKATQLKTVSTVTQFLQENCICVANWICRCCIKYDNNFFNVHQNLCSNLTIKSKAFEINANLALNDVVLYNRKFSGNNIPPFCFPLMPPLPLAACIKAHGFERHENNQIHACSNATLNFMGFDLINFRLGCIDFGLSGIELVDPDHEKNTEAPPEISLETSDVATEKCLQST